MPDLHEHMLEKLDRDLDTLTLGAGGIRPALENFTQPPRFRAIMLASDGTAAVACAEEWARAIAKAHRARVIVASVHRPAEMDVVVAGSYGLYPGIGALYEARRASLLANVTSLRDALQADGIDAESVLLEGSPSRELAEAAGTQGADLVVMGARGGNGVTRPLLGSIADALLDRVTGSVLVARRGPPPRRILVAADGSVESHRAVGYAVGLAERFDADLIVQHVLSHPDNVEVPSPGHLRDVVARMALSHPPHVTYVLDAGKPARKILERAHFDDVDIIVLGSRGLGHVKGAFLGSVSRRVANEATASVLLVKSPSITG